MYYLWLDDDTQYRNPQQRKPFYYEPITFAQYYFNPYNPNPDEIIWVHNYEEFVDTILKLGMPKMISFDNDLGKGLEGYDCAKWLVDYCLDNHISLPEWSVHSANPVAVENINTLLDNFKRSL